MSKTTPMMEQYAQIKAQVPDAFLFFRLGDFYELFYEDAIEAARELEITLTARGHGSESERIPMCGVPYHSAEQYILRLVEKGYKVAICEQTEDPKQAKGVVKREIVRIVTPGTVMEEGKQSEIKNNFIASVAASEQRYALCACDLTTGELYHTVVDHSFDSLVDELLVYSPSEIVALPELASELSQQFSSLRQRTLVTPWERPASERLQQIFGQEKIDSLSAVGQASLVLLFGYLEETQKRTLHHITAIRHVDPKRYMVLDPYTRRNLELIETVRDQSRKGSLLSLLDATKTAMGARMLRRWVDKPLVDVEQIKERQDAVEALTNDLITREEIGQHMKLVYDMERLVGRISYGSANARDLIALKISLQQVPALWHLCRQSRSTTLQRLVEHAPDCSDIATWIEQAIVDDPPISVREGGLIKAGYNQELDRYKEASQSGKQWIAELEREEREATGIKSLKIGFNKVFGYYIEITRSHLHAVPEGRYERKQTLANAERYVTAELKEKEALILEAEEKMAELEYELFVQLRDRLNSEVERLQKLAEIIATIDVYHSLAIVSSEYGYTRPVVTNGYDLKIENGRHPMVEAAYNDQPFISNSAELNEQSTRMLLITGPNMAGKSTYMRQVALICIMAQIGSFVPADYAQIPVIDRIFTRIGAADDLMGGLSTFMVEMRDIQMMTEHATKRSLLIIDELGRGTSTSEGMAIAQAVIEYLHHEVGAKTLISTHFHELAQLENELPYLHNVSMAVKESGREVTFLRKVIPGAASTSYGIYCAQIAGIRSDIIDRAYELLHLHEQRLNELNRSAEIAVAKEEIPIQEEDRRTTASKSVQNDVVQLRLFEMGDDADDNKKTNEIERQAIEALQKVDVLNMTPIAALQFINEWKQKLNVRQGK